MAENGAAGWKCNTKNGYIHAQKRMHEQGLRRGVRKQAQRHVTTLMRDTFLLIIFLQVNCCSDIC